MESIDFLRILVDEIHSVVVATADGEGRPVTRVIDMMLCDEKGVYFLTAKGKDFFRQLDKEKYISLSGMAGGKGTMEKRSVSLSGWVRNIGSEKRDEIFRKNPYMADIYPGAESREALDVFWLYKGQGQYFDLSTQPITRESFSLGGEKLRESGYAITSTCTGCGRCLATCPQACIEEGAPFVIHKEHCLHCGNCYDVCPSGAVIKI